MSPLLSLAARFEQGRTMQPRATCLAMSLLLGCGSAPPPKAEPVPKVPAPMPSTTPRPEREAPHPPAPKGPPPRLPLTRTSIQSTFEALMADDDPAARMSVVAIDDGCMERWNMADVAKRAPNGFSLKVTDTFDQAFVEDPAEAAFRVLHDFVSTLPLPDERRLLFASRFDGTNHVGWITVCAHTLPMITRDQLERVGGKDQLAFRILPGGVAKLKSAPSNTSHAVWLLDGRDVVIALPIETMLQHEEPVITLSKK